MQRRTFLGTLLSIPALKLTAEQFMQEEKMPPKKPRSLWRRGMSTQTGEVFLIGSSTTATGHFYVPYYSTTEVRRLERS
jgi:hypothetical protein